MKKVLEGEIIDEETHVYKRTSSGSIGLDPLRLPGWRLLISLVPVIGLIFAIIWYYYERSKQLGLIFPITAITIAIFSTTTFVILRFILTAIF